MRHRVIVWGTGFVGKLVIAELFEHPAFELAAVLAHDPRKDGVDAGVLVGGPARGLCVTTDVERALAIEADAVAYFGRRRSTWRRT
jgi:2,4-diaminopentanoate dehydrogenase